MFLADGSVFLRGQVLLENYRNLQGLKPVGSGFYSNLTAALPLWTNGPSAYVPLGRIQSGALEVPPAPPLPLQLPPVSGLRIFVTDLPTGVWPLESSSDLVRWEVLGQISSSDVNTGEFFITAQVTQKFYRIVSNY